jgi:3-oxoacyl-[acyl-carrier-protein] synthase-3
MRLKALACHIPNRRIDAEAIITAAGGRAADARVFTKLFGIERVAAAEPGEPPAERFAPALDALAAAIRTMPAEAVIYVHGLPTQYPPGHSPLTELLRARHPVVSSARLSYEIDQHNCAGLFWALEMARQLLATGLACCVAILAGDCLADFPLSRRYVPGCTLIGDAFVALLLDAGWGGVQVGAIGLCHRAEFGAGLDGAESEIRRFNQAHDEMVADALHAVAFPWAGHESLLPHNVNKLIWQQFCRRLQLDPARLRLDLVRDIGHCYTTDPFILLHQLLADGKWKSKAVTLLSIGLGAYTGACRVHFPGKT